MKIRIGVPMTDEFIESLNEGEKKFWQSFHQEAKELIKILKEKGNNLPYAPTESLQKKYEKAIQEYAGAKYCHVRQLESIFNFKEVRPCNLN